MVSNHLPPLKNMEGASKVAGLVKDYDSQSKILLFGGYIAALPKKTLQDELAVDFVCTNEGVYTISNLLELKDFETSNLKKISGLGYRDGNQIVLNQPSSIVPKKI